MRVVSRAVRSKTRPTEETRAYLQTRLALFAKVMFWSFVTLLVFISGMYWQYPHIVPARNNEVIAGAAVGLTGMAALWRLVLVRMRLSIEALYRLDLFFSMGIGTTFAFAAALAPELRAAGYASLIYAIFTVFMRAIVVPSRGARTAVAAALVFLPSLPASIYLAVTSTTELPGPAFVLGMVLFASVAVALAHTGSRTIYSLSQKVSEARQLGEYMLDDVIGEGGMGRVYRARHRFLRRPTAVKRLLPDLVGAGNMDRFEREVQHMAQLTHPNSVAVYDYGRSHDGVVYYAMEYLNGLDLGQLVKQYGPQPPGRVVPILIQVCGALQEAHDLGMIHRDIKPANIILCERGGVPDVAKVLDYGLVKEITHDTSQSTQVVMGTPGYVAPEVVTDAKLGPAVDIYAVGAVAYALLTGRRVFEGTTAISIMMQHVTSAVTPPSERSPHPISPALDAIVLRCLDKEPEGRFPSARDLAEALEALPAGDDWSRAAATAWWKRWKPAATVSTETATMTIDLADRA